MDENENEGRVIRTVPADTFGHRLMLARAEKGHLTIDDAARQCGQGAQNWSNWEHGRMPRDKVEVAEAVAEALGIDRDWLLHGGPLTPPVRPSRLRATYHRRASFNRPGPRRPRRVDRDRVAA